VAAQNASEVQLRGHVPAVHWYAPQSDPVVAAPHWFGATQTCAFATFPWQTLAPHTVPSAHVSHLPAPSQEPSCPQPLAGWAAHSSSGSVPAAMTSHCPFTPPPFFAALHAWQPPAHAEPQQTPSTQNPEPHSAPVLHAAPTARCCAQVVPWQ
jgi:hypothetical protein